MLAVEGGGEEEDVEDDADGVQHAQLRDQAAERELQPQLRAVDHQHRHQVACAFREHFHKGPQLTIIYHTVNRLQSFLSFCYSVILSFGQLVIW